MTKTPKEIGIDNKDRKILLELDTDAEQSLKQIARKLRTTKEAVSYRIKQLEGRGIIHDYMAVYNPAKLGLMYFKLYIKFAHATEEKRREILDFVKKRRNLSWFAVSEGPYDLMIGVHFSSVAGFEKYKDELFYRFGSFFQKISYAILTEGEAYPRQYILGTPNPMRKVFLFCSPSEKEGVDEKDLAIVRELSVNARAPLTEIAKRTGLTPTIVRYRKGLLEKKGVITGYKIFVDYRKLGHMFFKCLLKIHVNDIKRFNEIRSYARQHPNIVYWMKVLGEWSVELDIEVSSIEEFYKIANEIRGKFSDAVQSFDVLLVTEDSAIGPQENNVTLK